MQNTTKNHIIEAAIFDADDKGFTNSIKEDVKERDGEILDLPTVQSYSHAVTITRMHWGEIDITDCFELSILSDLDHSLRIVDDTGVVTARHVCYNLNLFYNSLTNNLELGT